jgi:hypothetical protein
LRADAAGSTCHHDHGAGEIQTHCHSMQLNGACIADLCGVRKLCG